LIQHHEGHPPVALKRVVQGELDDRFPLPEFKPEVPWNRGVVFVDFAVALDPTVKFALWDGQPRDEVLQRDLRFVAPLFGKINNGIANIMGNPAAG
jgi:hypothetical protein